MRRAVLALAAVPALFAQFAGVDAPSAAFFFDASSRSIRRITGFPGSAHVDSTVASDLDFASVSRQGTRVVGVRNGRLIALGSLAEADGIDLGEAPQSIRVTWNDEGSAAAILADNNRLHLVRFHSDAPRLIPLWNANEPDANVGSAVVTADGRQVVFTVRSANASGIYAAGEHEPYRLMLPLGRPEALALSADGTTLFAADVESMQIIELRDFASSAIPQVFAVLPEGSLPISAATVNGSPRLAVADRQRRALDIYDLKTRKLAATIALDFEPKDLLPLGWNTALLVDVPSRSGQPLQVVDAARLELYFVPAPMLPEQAAGVGSLE